MKRRMMILSAAALTFAMAGPVMAQYNPDHVTNGGIANADAGFFDSHPNLSKRLAADPTLIDNKQFVDHHPELHSYLETHPNVRAEFRNHPYKFMHREAQYDKHHN